MTKTEMQKEELRTFVLIFVTLITIGMILLAKMFFEGVVYLTFLVIGIVIMFSFNRVFKLSGKKGDSSKRFYGISNRWILGSLIGILAGIGFLLLTKVKIFGVIITMITPSAPLSIGSQGIVVCLIAPLAETIFFTCCILSILHLFMPLFLAIPLKMIIFSSYHYWAYVIVAGNTLESVIGSFIGAGIFALIGSLLAVYWGAEADATAHGVFNSWNFNSLYHVFSVTN